MLILEFSYPKKINFAYHKIIGNPKSIWNLWWELKNIKESYYGKPYLLELKVKNLDGETLDLSKYTEMEDFQSFDTP